MHITVRGQKLNFEPSSFNFTRQNFMMNDKPQTLAPLQPMPVLVQTT